MDFECTPVGRLMLRLAPPVMFSLLIRSVYNIVDSWFIARYSPEGFTALSIFLPVQTLVLALAIGIGTGLNILISHMDGEAGDRNVQEEQDGVVKSGLFLSLVNYAVVAGLGILFTDAFFGISSDNPLVRGQGGEYSRIVLAGILWMVIEIDCSKVLQAKGDMVTPMYAQAAGAVFNIAADPVLIYGLFGFPALGVRGAAYATVAGQFVAMCVSSFPVYRMYRLRGRVSLRTCADIYWAGAPSMIMQSLFTFYIMGLNLILKLFTEDAVTVLGVYYKLQMFYNIPMLGMQQALLPVISYSYGAGNMRRVREIIAKSALFSVAVMLAATLLFFLFPKELLSIYSRSPSVLETGIHAFRVISLSFIPLGLFMVFTTYFQGAGCGRYGIITTLVRQVLLFVPLAWLFHYAGLKWVWYTFPVTEVLTAASCAVLYASSRRGRTAPGDGVLH